MYFSAALIALFAGSQLVAGHSAIIKAVGDAGGEGSAIGVNPATPRDGTKRNPFQQDATRFRGASAATCGETLAGGTNDLAADTTTMMQQTGGTLPQISQGGSLNMTVHQVNADGGGPYSCAINSDGTATTWQNIQVTQNLEGNNRGVNRATAEMDLPLNVQIPASQSCTGTVAGQENVCVVRCMNAAKAAGPFGGCVPVQMAGAAPAATAATAATKRSIIVRSAKFGNENINKDDEEEEAYDY